MVMGAGTVTRNLYLHFIETKETNAARVIVSWAQGYFSARNTAGKVRPAAVRGTVSASTFEAMLADQCREIDGTLSVVIAARKLYEKMESKGP